MGCVRLLRRYLRHLHAQFCAAFVVRLRGPHKILVGDLQIMLERDLGSGAQPLGDHVQRKGAGQFGFPAGAKVLETTSDRRPRLPAFRSRSANRCRSRRWVLPLPHQTLLAFRALGCLISRSRRPQSLAGELGTDQGLSYLVDCMGLLCGESMRVDVHRQTDDRIPDELLDDVGVCTDHCQPRAPRVPQ